MLNPAKQALRRCLDRAPANSDIGFRQKCEMRGMEDWERGAGVWRNMMTSRVRRLEIRFTGKVGICQPPISGFLGFTRFFLILSRSALRSARSDSSLRDNASLALASSALSLAAARSCSVYVMR